MANLNIVRTTSRHFRVDGISPASHVGHILRANTEGFPSRVVNVRLEEHVINLSVQVDTTVTSVESAGNPGNPCVLQVAGGSTPSSVETNEEGHLLTAIEVVDDGSDTFGVKASSGSESGNLLGRGGVADRGRVVPETTGANARTGLETGGGEVTDITEGDELLDTITASTKCGGTVVGTGVDIILDHSDTVLELVGIELIPLISGQGTLESSSTIVIADFGSNDNTAKVSTGSTVEGRESNTTRGNNQAGERNTVGIKTGAGNTNRGSISGNDQDVSCDRSVVERGSRG